MGQIPCFFIYLFSMPLPHVQVNRQSFSGCLRGWGKLRHFFFSDSVRSVRCTAASEWAEKEAMSDFHYKYEVSVTPRACLVLVKKYVDRLMDGLQTSLITGHTDCMLFIHVFANIFCFCFDRRIEKCVFFFKQLKNIQRTETWKVTT